MPNEQLPIAGNAPTNQPANNVNDKRVFRVDASKMRIGTKKQEEIREVSGPSLPPPHFEIEMVEEGEYTGAVKCTSVLYGWPSIKDKEENRAGTLTGRIVQQLDLAQTRTPVPVLVQTDENERGTRMLIDYDVTDPDTGEIVTKQFAVTARSQFYGKAVESVQKRGEGQKAAPKGQPAQNRAAQPARQNG